MKKSSFSLPELYQRLGEPIMKRRSGRTRKSLAWNCSGPCGDLCLAYVDTDTDEFPAEGWTYVPCKRHRMRPAPEVVRDFYGRLAPALITAEEQSAFERQIQRAEIVELDDEHDEFRFSGAPDPLEALNEDTIECVYADADGRDVNVIIHFVGDHISWAERYRNLGDPIRQWPPPPDSPLRLGRSEPPK